MSDVSIKAVRRVHVYIGPNIRVPVDIRCPDCNSTIFKRGERLHGCVNQQCRRCKDSDGDRKIWHFIFHEDIQSYIDAVKRESFEVDIESTES